jgi:hypothetical protein
MFQNTYLLSIPLKLYFPLDDDLNCKIAQAR